MFLSFLSIDELEKSEYEKHGFTFFLQKPVSKKAFEQLMAELKV